MNSNKIPLLDKIISCTLPAGVGIAILIISAISELEQTGNIELYIKSNILTFLFCGTLIFISIYSFIYYILNGLVKPKKEVLYFKEYSEGEAIFITKHGKKIHYEYSKKYEKNKFYNVLKTTNEIKQIIGESNSQFELPKEKLHKKKIQETNITEEEKISKGKKTNIILIIIELLQYPIMVLIMFKFYTMFASSFDRVIFMPFLICVIAEFIMKLAVETKKYDLTNLMYKTYVFSFLVYWFGILTYGLIQFIKDQNYLMLVYESIFWIIGVFIVYRFFIKKY